MSRGNAGTFRSVALEATCAARARGVRSVPLQRVKRCRAGVKRCCARAKRCCTWTQRYHPDGAALLYGACSIATPRRSIATRIGSIAMQRWSIATRRRSIAIRRAQRCYTERAALLCGGAALPRGLAALLCGGVALLRGRTALLRGRTALLRGGRSIATRIGSIAARRCSVATRRVQRCYAEGAALLRGGAAFLRGDGALPHAAFGRVHPARSVATRESAHAPHDADLARGAGGTRSVSQWDTVSHCGAGGCRTVRTEGATLRHGADRSATDAHRKSSGVRARSPQTAG